MSEIIYPKILSNIPSGKDEFKSGAHENIANTIINLIETQSPVIEKQIIGLEGGWGTGKSNVIRIIEENSKDKFLHFTFDSWTHQEDLTRKSILEELIGFLQSKDVIQIGDSLWKQKEEELSQKKIIKNTQFFPLIRLYYVLFIFAFFIIKFVNESYKFSLDGKLYGFYENSYQYIFENFHINIYNEVNWILIFKLFPHLLILAGVGLFFNSLNKERNLNKNRAEEDRLSVKQILSRQFHWIAGEKSQSDSNESVIEKEPSNQRFRSFLSDIDNKLDNKKLIFTIDNTDRLSNLKLSGIWSTINIFFAENTNKHHLENIWLIIPYDEQRINNSMPDSEGLGLLEKTFAITFKVPPPLLSNWEQFFENAFNKAFEGIKIPKKREELNFLKTIYSNWEESINPRKIINFINQLTTYYIQNNDINLRYNAVFIFNKESLFDGNIYDNILNRHSYLKDFESAFIEDKNLEINIARIAFGIKTIEDAKEALFSELIENVLAGHTAINKTLTGTPYFNSFFNRVFEKFISKNSSENREMLDRLTNLLLDLETQYSYNPKIYKSLWERFTVIIVLRNPLLSFTTVQESVLKYCSKETSLKLIQNNISYNIQLKGQTTQGIDLADEYYNFLKALDRFLLNSKSFRFEDIQLSPYNVSPEDLFKFVRTDNQLFHKYKITVIADNLKSFFTNPLPKISRNNLKLFYNEIISLENIYNIDFIAHELSNNWLNKTAFSDLIEVKAFYYYQEYFENKETPLKLAKMDLGIFNSMTNVSTTMLDLENLEYALFLILTNFEPNTNVNLEQIRSILSNKDLQLSDNLTSSFLKKDIDVLVNVLKITVTSECNSILAARLASEIIKNRNSKVNPDNGLWLLSNYSSIIQFTVNLPMEVYDFIDYNTNGYDIDLSIVDLRLLDFHHGILSGKILTKARMSLENNIPKNIFADSNKVEFKIVIKLIELDRIPESSVPELQKAFIYIASSNYALKDETINNLLKLRDKHFSNLTIDLNALNSRGKNLGLLGDTLLDSMVQHTPQLQNLLMENLINNHLTISVIEFIFQGNNNKWMLLLKNKLKTLTKDHPLLEYTQSKGLV